MPYRCCYIQPYDHILIDYRSKFEHKTSQMWETDMVTNSYYQRNPKDRLEIKNSGLNTIKSLKQEIKFQYFKKKSNLCRFHSLCDNMNNIHH